MLNDKVNFGVGYSKFNIKGFFAFFLT